MKNIYLLLFSILLLSSCSTDSEPLAQQEAEEEFVTVGVSLGGELTVKESPLRPGTQAATKAADVTDSEDLFGIQIFDAVNDVPYAFVVGNDISKISFELKKNRQYDIEIYYLKNGLNIVEQWEYEDGTRWSTPFYTEVATELNKVQYSPNADLYALYYGEIRQVNSNSARYLPEDAYYQFLEHATVQEESDELHIDLKRMVFGITLNLDLGPENTLDQVVFQIAEEGNYIKYPIDLEDGKGRLEIPYITLSSYLRSAIHENYREKVLLSLVVENQPSYLFLENLYAKRNTMHHISFTADITGDGGAGTTTGNIKFNLEETEMEDLYIDFSDE